MQLLHMYVSIQSGFTCLQAIYGFNLVFLIVHMYVHTLVKNPLEDWE